MGANRLGEPDDPTERGRASDPTRDGRLAKILDASGDAMLAWTSEGRIVEANPAASRLTGIPREQLLADTMIQDLLEPFPSASETAEPLRAARLELIAGRGTDSQHRLPVSVTISAVEGDPLIVAHALIRDESQVVLAERDAAAHLARIRLLEAELRTLLDNAPLIIFRLDPSTGRLLYLNRHAERLLGVPTDDALRTPGFLRMAHTDQEGANAFDEAFEGARCGARSPPYEARLRGNTDVEIAVRGTIYPLLSDDGRVVAVEGILADVSAEYAARTRLVQADRLSTLGMLAAGVAHEINNPAAFLVLGLGQLARLVSSNASQRTDETSSLPKLDAETLVMDLRESIDRIVRITRDLRLFASSSAGEHLQLVPIDVNGAVHSALTLARAQLMERTRITINLEPVPPVLMEEGRLAQVLVNLLVNAAHAIAKQPGHEHVVSVTTHGSADKVEIAVSDTGVGIRPGELERIWLPFFTTKTSDVGTGLGLSISREIIEQAGGSIRVESPTLKTQGRAHGSRFVVSLPSAEPSQLPASPPVSIVNPPLPPPRRRRRVLVIDDERALLVALASELGRVHDVATASDGREGLHLMSEQRFDAVLCDLRMPGISGETLFRHLREHDRNHAGVLIFMTGIGFGGDAEPFLLTAGRPCLEKPFSLEQALDAIESVGGASAASLGSTHGTN